MTLWLGCRWPGCESLPPPPGGVDWRAHYRGHRSFPIPLGEAAVSGQGVAVVDVGDFAAVQAVHSLQGRWLVIAVVPPLAAGSDDYDVRVQTEARIYGGLRDLELTAVARPEHVNSVFIVDVPGRQASVPQCERMAKAVWSLWPQWDIDHGEAAPWPRVCRTLNLWPGSDTAEAAGEAGWQRHRVSADGAPPPAGAIAVANESRNPAVAPPLLFHSGDEWLAIGRPCALSQFPITRITFESAGLAFGPTEATWPEPGAPGLESARRFLAVGCPQRVSASLDSYLDALSGSQAPVGARATEGLPEYVRRWLGAVRGGRGV